MRTLPQRRLRTWVIGGSSPSRRWLIHRLAGGSAPWFTLGSERLLLAAVVLDVRDSPVRETDGLEEQRLAHAPVVCDPVDADDEAVAAGRDELGRAGTAVARPRLESRSLSVEDRPGLVGAPSARGAFPPEEAALDPAPLGVRLEQAGEQRDVALVRGLVGLPDHSVGVTRHMA